MSHYVVSFYEPYSKKIINIKSIDYLFYKWFINTINTMSPFSKKFYIEKLLKWIDKVSI